MVASSFASQTTPLLGGRALLLARITWLVLVVLQVASFAWLLPLYIPLAAHPCPQNCVLTSQEAQSLTRAGISPIVYMWILLILAVVNVLLASTMAGILFVRRSHDVMALITAYFVVILPTTYLINFAPTAIGTQQTTAFAMPLVIEIALELLQTGLIYGMFLLFPSGRFVPRWSWMLLVGFTAYTQVFSALPALAGVLAVGWVFFFLSAGACIGYRYWRVSTARARQQTKWVIFGFATFLLASQAYWMPTFTPLGNTVYAPLSYLVYQVFLPVVPITFFIAIQYHRLYDIDAIIRRALVYGSLTGSLAAIYAGLIIGLQPLVGGLIGRNNSFTIVISTLLIAALFNPLRLRIQRFIDRRFYRRKYDAAKTLAAVSTALRQEVNLDELRNHLVAVVDETMQPTHVSLWLSRSPRLFFQPPEAAEMVEADRPLS